MQKTVRRRLFAFLGPAALGLALAGLSCAPGADADSHPATAAAAARSSAAPRLSPGPKESALTRAWREAGLDERRAAAHLLDRFAFGPRPGEVDRVVARGLDAWLDEQLAAAFPETGLTDPKRGRLRAMKELDLPAGELAAIYQTEGRIWARAREAGAVPSDVDPRTLEGEELAAFEARLRRFAEEEGLKPLGDLVAHQMSAKLVRGVYAENRLKEVMADFWFNHFYVSMVDPRARAFVFAYERDVIRAHALGDFRELLGASARHPAMLLYLDNARSAAGEGVPTTLEARADDLPAAVRRRVLRRLRPAPGKGRGLNENYARELLELHTLGVDGGYSQADVVETARAFTGWTIAPPGEARARLEGRLRRLLRGGDHEPGALGYVLEGEFAFRPDLHDAAPKTVMGRSLPGGRGIEDGEEVLDLLASHPATARHLAEKLAVRFVRDDPPPALVERLAEVFLRTEGDVRAVLRALAESPEMWAPETLHSKVKSPFELAVSALRALDAEVGDSEELLHWIARMGQPLYLYEAPTGYPESSEGWVSTGALLQRMSFGLRLASGRVDGVSVDLAALTGGREPESVEDTLRTYLELLMPARDHSDAVELLTPMVHASRLSARMARLERQERAAGQAVAEKAARAGRAGDTGEAAHRRDGFPFGLPFRSVEDAPGPEPLDSPGPLRPGQVEQVVGVILGSPAFQQR